MKAILIIVIHVMTWIQISCDPCTNYKNLDSVNDYTRSIANSASSNYLCDNTLTAGWYRVNSNAGEKMPTQCIFGGTRCGTMNSIWMNGTYPVSNQTKYVTACAANYDGNCCAYSHNIQVKNCTNYLVYHLVPVSPCYQAYCFGYELPCPAGQTSNNGFSPGCEPDACVSTNHKMLEGEAKRSANYTLKGNDIAIEDSRLKTGWYRIDSVTGNDIVNYSVPMMHCGTLYPLWMKGSIPLEVNKTVERKVCRSGLTYTCAEEYNIRVKNCGEYRTYYLTQLNVDKSAYCFGTLPVHVSNTTTSPSDSVKITSTTINSTTSSSTTSISLLSSTTRRIESKSSTILDGPEKTTETVDNRITLPNTDGGNNTHIWIIITAILGITTTGLLILVFLIHKRKFPVDCLGSSKSREHFDPPTYEEAVQKDTIPHIYDDIVKVTPDYEEIDSDKMVSGKTMNARYISFTGSAI